MSITWPFKELSSTTKVNLQCQLYCPTYLSGSATVVSLDICFWRKQPSATSCMPLIILVWWTGISSSSVSPGIIPYPLERYDGGLGTQFIRHFKVTLGQIQFTWSSTLDGPRFSHSSSISMGIDYLLQSPCSTLLFHCLVRRFILVAEPNVVKQRKILLNQLVYYLDEPHLIYNRFIYAITSF